jgi:hypothetical protein
MEISIGEAPKKKCDFTVKTSLDSISCPFLTWPDVPQKAFYTELKYI